MAVMSGRSFDLYPCGLKFPAELNKWPVTRKAREIIAKAKSSAQVNDSNFFSIQERKKCTDR
jgi:hypothetical protein